MPVLYQPLAICGFGGMYTAYSSRRAALDIHQIQRSAEILPRPQQRTASDAVTRAVRFLLGARNRDGWWRDFDTLAGSSDEWVSAYVACALARSSIRSGVSAAEDIWSRIVRRRWWSSAWGFNSKVPPDSDTTLWIVTLGQILGHMNSLRIRRAIRWLERQIQSDGGVATYGAALPIRIYTRLSAQVSFEGWCSSHVCVSALAASTDIPARRRILQYVRRHQQDDGSWPSYWWCDSEYSTALAVTALHALQDAGDATRIERAVKWAIERQSSSARRSPFASAYRLQILAASGSRAEAEARDCIESLLELQNSDGSWPASSRLRIPPPGVVDPDKYSPWSETARGGGAIIVDRGRKFTTATVLSALAIAMRTYDA
jgi:hypothetical protein